MTFRIISTMETYKIQETLKSGMTIETAERTLLNMGNEMRKKYPEIRITRSKNLYKFWFDSYYVTIKIKSDGPNKISSTSN